MEDRTKQISFVGGRTQNSQETSVRRSVDWLLLPLRTLVAEECVRRRLCVVVLSLVRGPSVTAGKPEPLESMRIIPGDAAALGGGAPTRLRRLFGRGVRRRTWLDDEMPPLRSTLLFEEVVCGGCDGGELAKLGLDKRYWEEDGPRSFGEALVSVKQAAASCKLWLLRDNAPLRTAGGGAPTRSRRSILLQNVSG